MAQKQYPETKALSQVQGVGTLTALPYVLTIADKHRFRHSRDVGCYLGLRPKRSQSGEHDPPLGITRAGNSYWRCLHYRVRPLYCGPLWSGQRAAALGPKTGGAGWQECARPRRNCRGAATVGAVTSVMGHRRVVSALPFGGRGLERELNFLFSSYRSTLTAYATGPKRPL